MPSVLRYKVVGLIPADLKRWRKRMKRSLTSTRPLSILKEGHVKAILRGGTFHRVQVLVPHGQPFFEHCGLNYKVTHQKDDAGRIICIWSRN